MSTCPHSDTVPVDVRDHASGRVETVARICTHCLDKLPAGWGCTVCEWAPAPRRICDPGIDTALILTRSCEAHR